MGVGMQLSILGLLAKSEWGVIPQENPLLRDPWCIVHSWPEEIKRQLKMMRDNQFQEVFRFGTAFVLPQDCVGKCGDSISLSVTSWFLLSPGSFHSHATDNYLWTSGLERKPSARTYKGLEIPDLISHLPFGKENIFQHCFSLDRFPPAPPPHEAISGLRFLLFTKNILFVNSLKICHLEFSVRRCDFMWPWWDRSSCLGLGLPGKVRYIMFLNWH